MKTNKFKSKLSTRQSRYLEILNKIKNKQIPQYKSPVLLVDGLNLFFRSFAAVPTMNSSGEHTGGLYGSLLGLRATIDVVRPRRCIIIFDGKNGSKNRRKLYPEYKANRGKMRTINRTHEWLDAKEERESCFLQLEKFISYLDLLPVTAISVEGIEADDAIAYYASKIFNNDDVVIMSSDKDYYQLASEHCTIWSPTKKVFYDVNKIKTQFNIHPNNFTIFRAIDGDKSDNIPGIKGIGIKTVNKLYPELINETIVSLDEIFEKTEKNLPNNAYEKILNNKDVVIRNYALMQLYDPEINASIKSQLLDVVKKQKISIANQINIRQKLLRDGLYSQMKYFSNWYSSFNQLNTLAVMYNKQIDTTGAISA